ncbi:MAG: hypothetical protein JXB60_01460 [Candidatus Cloacimonetes bacterium]|nr:hypothetical protein [Candidatus Cloacimonadota bacterium]
MRTFLFLLVLTTVISGCDIRRSSEPDFIYIDIHQDDFDQNMGWTLLPVYNSVLNDTAWAVIGEGQLKLGAQGGTGNTTAAAIYTFPDSLVDLCTGYDLLLEFKIINSVAYNTGDCSITMIFDNGFISISFTQYELFNYYNGVIGLKYEQEDELVYLLANGAEKDLFFMDDPGEIAEVSLNVWTLNATGNGYAILNAEWFKIYRLEEED